MFSLQRNFFKSFNSIKSCNLLSFNKVIEQYQSLLQNHKLNNKEEFLNQMKSIHSDIHFIKKCIYSDKSNPLINLHIQKVEFKIQNLKKEE
jgi:hypothetical protein